MSTRITFLAALCPTSVHVTELCPIAIEDRVLVGDLDQLRLLIHDQHGLRKDRAESLADSVRVETGAAEAAARDLLANALRRDVVERAGERDGSVGRRRGSTRSDRYP